MIEQIDEPQKCGRSRTLHVMDIYDGLVKECSDRLCAGKADTEAACHTGSLCDCDSVNVMVAYFRLLQRPHNRRRHIGMVTCRCDEWVNPLGLGVVLACHDRG